MTFNTNLFFYSANISVTSYPALILEADGRDFLGIPLDPSAITGVQVQDPPTSPVPMYGPPLSACTPFESLLGQEVVDDLFFIFIFIFYCYVLFCTIR